MRLATYRRRAGRGVRGIGIVGYPADGHWLNRWGGGWGGRGGMGVVGYPADGSWRNPNWSDRWGGYGLAGLGQNYTMNFQQWMQQNPQCVGPNGIICPMPSYVNPSAYTGIAQTGSPLNFVSSSVQNLANSPNMITANVNDSPGMTAYTGDLASHLAQGVTYILAAPGNTTDATQAIQSIATQYCGLYGNQPGGTDIGCGNMAALVKQYAAEANQSLAAAAAHPSQTATYSPPVKTTIVTNPGAKTNAVSSNAPAPGPNPAYQTPQSGNALQPYRATYHGSVATGSTVLNPLNSVNTLPTDTISNTGAGGAVQLAGDASGSGSNNTWLIVAAIGVGVIVLMMNTQGGAA